MSIPAVHCRSIQSRHTFSRLQFDPRCLKACILAALLGVAGSSTVQAAMLPSVSADAKAGSFPLVDRAAAEVVFDEHDAKVVSIAAGLFADDVEKVTGVRPQINSQTKAGATPQQPCVVIGTIGQSRLIDELVAAGKVDVTAVRGKWEAYTLAVVANPWPGVKQALVVAGADRRGTAYGVFTLSEAIGVSPWAWWADVHPTKRTALHVNLPAPQTDAPRVKYRGLFINDEDWGFTPWAGKTLDPALGNVGPKTYAKVFELLLRLKGNYFWPAMHLSTKEFAQVPGNVQTADDWAIVMGSSHAEPMLRNNVRWNNENRGPWRYDTNQKTIYDYWQDYAKSRGKFEAVWTVGMRGVHDTPMEGPADMGARVKLLDKAITDQRGLIGQYVNRDVEKVPQAFLPYKETLAIYQAGLKVPDDVTLLWCEDNYGYLRQLSTPQEQKRAGGSGVYYHISYLGNPGTYLWVESTPLALIWTEMNKALQYGADRMWILNVGDIKNNEIGANFWLSYAWQPDHFNGDAQQTFLHEWAATTFGDANADEVAAVMNDYFRLAMQRKPEHSRPGVFKADGYGEAQSRLAAFTELDRRATALAERLPSEKRDGYYSLVLYKVHVAARVAESFADLELNRLAVAQGRAGAAVDYGTQAKAAVDRIRQETTAYNETFLGGKWKNAISFRGITVGPNYKGWINNVILKWPEPVNAPPIDGPAKIGIAVDGNDAVMPDGVVPPVDKGVGDINLNFAKAEIAPPWKRSGDLIGVPDGTGEILKPEDAKGITLPFNLPEAGTYNLFGQVVAPDKKADSFFVRVDKGAWATWNDIPGCAEPSWRKQAQYKLAAGEHTITIANREDGAQISALRLTQRDAADLPDLRYAVPGRLPTFADTPGRRTAVVRVFRTDGAAVEAKVTSSAAWIKAEKTEAVGNEKAFKVSVDFAAAPKTDAIEGTVVVEAGGQSTTLAVHVVQLPTDGTFGEVDSVVSIPVAKFTRTKAGKAAEWFVVPHLGREGDAVTLRPATAPGLTEPARIIAEASVLEYDFTATTAGPFKLTAYCLPTHRIHEGRGQRYAVSIDDAAPTIVDFSAESGESGESGARWSEGRLRNVLLSTSQHALTRPGRHTFKLWMVDPGVVVDKLVLDFGGERDSELGPPPTAISR